MQTNSQSYQKVDHYCFCGDEDMCGMGSQGLEDAFGHHGNACYLIIVMFL
jgi:hypothetical protein